MEIQYSISNPGLFLFLFVIISLSLAFGIYHYKKNDLIYDKTQRLVLSSIKFIYLFFILYLLLAPLVEQSVNRSEKPILLIGIDNSESMIYVEESRELINDLTNNIKSALSAKFNIETFLFGEETILNETPDFADQKSNYSNFFMETEKRYFNMNLGTVILIGDGIYNEGQNPEQTIQRINAPVFSVGVGDTATYIDQSIMDVTHNPNVFLGNSFPVEVEMLFTRFPHQNTQLSIYIDGKLEKTDVIEIPQPDYYHRQLYNVTANQIGLRNVSIVLSPVSEEQNTRNNRQNFTIEVHDNRKEILFLSQGPHPDIGALSTTLINYANFRIKTEDITLFNGDIESYDLVVLHQLPSVMTQRSNVFNSIKESNVPVLLITGPRTSISALNNLGLGIELEPTSVNEESLPFFNENFALFNLPANIREIENIYPPLITHYTQYNYDPALAVVAYQKIKGIEMNYPLILAGEINRRKTGIILGEGVWRWPLREHLNYNNRNAFNQIMVNLFNYLTLQEEREQFRVIYDRIATEYTPVVIKAQVFNEIFEPVSQAEIHFTLIDSAGNELSYLFDPAPAGYQLNLGVLPSGNYSFTAETSIANTVFARSGNFSIQEVSIEQQSLQANFAILNYIASNTGGKFFAIANSDSIINLLSEKDNITERIHKEKNIFELIDWKWLLLLIFGLTTLEWFLRKFWGSY